MQDYEKLKVFHRADGLVVRVYEVTRSFPSDELYGLRSQLRRAAVSVAANIVEGARLSSAREFGRQLSSALGSASEVEYLLGLSGRLGYIDRDVVLVVRSEANEICRMLSALHGRVLQASNVTRPQRAVTVSH